MTTILATVEFPMLGPDAGDKVVNSFVFHSDVADLADAHLLADEISSFYKDIPTGFGAGRIGEMLSSTLDRSTDAVTTRMYDIAPALDGSPHGSPIWEGHWTLSAAALEDDLPNQIAVCVTLRGRDAMAQPIEAADGADPGAAVDRPRQRHSGRLYLGPFNMTALDSTPGSAPLVSQDTRYVIEQSCEDLQDALNAKAEPWIWCTWSRTNATVYGITRIEVDNSFDVIRRRKSRSTIRDVRVFAPVPDVALGA